MANCLVTGGAGFIGSYIVERLLKDGHNVVILDNFSTGREENLSFIGNYTLSANRYTLIKGDIRDEAICDRACQDIDYLFHQAALRSVPKSLEIPREFNAVNIDGTLNLLEASRRRRVKRFIFASSSSIYGETEHFPQKEDDPPGLISPYALTKLAGEYYCRVFSHNYELETVSLRYFNVFGPGQALDDEYAVVIPKFISRMLNNQSPPIHGSGRQSRDFTYIDNVVEANILSATADGMKNEVFNVACGRDRSILDLVACLNEIMGKSIEPAFIPPRQGDVFRTCADISKIESILKYKPKIYFEEGLKRTVEWFNESASP